ncbi:MAG: ATP-binding protein [Pseudomonadota bacterium]
MGQANANGVRANWRGTLKNRMAAWALPTVADAEHLRRYGHTRITIPLWQYFLKSEAFFRRLIPLLIILLLTFAAVSRVGSMMNQSESLHTEAEQKLGLLTSLLALRLSQNPSFEDLLTSPTLADVLLEDALEQPGEDNPLTASRKHLVVFVLDSDNRVIAQRPPEGDFDRAHLSRLTDGIDMTPLPGKRSRSRTILLEGERPALAYYRPLVFDDDAKSAALLTLMMEQNIYKGWYQRANLNVVLFIAMSIVLLVVLYAYFAQGARVRETDALYTENNARFDTALLRGHCGLWDWDLSRGSIVWSRSMYQMLGLKASEQALGFGDLSQMMHPDDPDMIALANQAFQSDKTQLDHRFRMRHASGTWIWMRLRAELVRYKGSAPHLIGIAVDISEQEALEQKTRDADIRLRDAIENISEAFVLWDAKKRLVMCNSKYQQLYSLPASATKSGLHHDTVMEQSRRPKAQNLVSMPSKFENGTKTFEMQIENGNWLQISERRTQDGGFVSVGTDITQIKRNQAKLEESERLQLATIADLRGTQQKLERQAQQLVEFADNLNEQKKRADAGNQAKSEFLANISHELRTPLNAIIGFSDIMRAKMFGPMGSEKYVEYADDIHDSGNFLLGVINDVLDMSRIEAGRLQLRPETIALDRTLQESTRFIQMQADKAQITVSHTVCDDLKLTGDRRSVKQILLNLLSNAVKFTPENGEIEVEAREENGHAMIKIADNGIGIPSEALERLGRPFEQVQAQMTKNHKGSGLGLAIARSLANLHGGSLKITSEVGVGTTVTVSLPIECAIDPKNLDDSGDGNA